MSGLPFITAPKAFESVEVGSANCGVLAIKKLKGLSVNERKYLKELTKDLPDLRKEAVRMAKTIAAEMGTKLVEVYSALTAGDTEYLSDHLEAVLEFQDKMEQVTEQRIPALATTIIKFRIDPAWAIEDTGNADTIHPELVAAIAEFASNEESGWAQPEAAEVTEEDLGNS